MSKIGIPENGRGPAETGWPCEIWRGHQGRLEVFPRNHSQSVVVPRGKLMSRKRPRIHVALGDRMDGYQVASGASFCHSRHLRILNAYHWSPAI